MVVPCNVNGFFDVNGLFDMVLVRRRWGWYKAVKRRVYVIVCH
jgi:hypothetical protein